MAKRKNQRMFSRDERKAYSAAIAAVPQEAKDDAEIRSMFRGGVSDVMLAETWLGLREESGKTAYELTIMRTIERVFVRRTGDTLTVETADGYMDADAEEREIQHYRDALARGEDL